MPTTEAAALASAIAAETIRLSIGIAVAESLTGGDVVSAFVSVPGASATLRGGIVAYDTRIKASVLGVDGELLDRAGAVDPEVAAQMAARARDLFAVDGERAELGIATTGVAGPDAQDGKPVGLVYVAVSDARGEQVQEHRFSGGRVDIRDSATAAALALAASRLGVR